MSPRVCLELYTTTMRISYYHVCTIGLQHFSRRLHFQKKIASLVRWLANNSTPGWENLPSRLLDGSTYVRISVGAGCTLLVLTLLLLTTICTDTVDCIYTLWIWGSCRLRVSRHIVICAQKIHYVHIWCFFFIRNFVFSLLFFLTFLVFLCSLNGDSSAHSGSTVEGSE